MALRRLIGLIFVSVIASSAGALTYSGGIEYIAGNEATVAVDFDFDNSFLFTYKWDGEATGWVALSAIDQAGALDVVATDYGEMGMFVNDLAYPGGQKFDYGEGVYAGWAYYGSSDGVTWSLNQGVSFRSLSNGDWDSWVWTNYDEFWNPVRAPGEQPIPEPTTIALLGLGGLLLRKSSPWRRLLNEKPPNKLGG